MSSIAILVFAQTSVVESGRKPLVDGYLNNFFLYENLNKRILSLTKKIALPFFWYDENSQKGVSFGERLINAVAETFQKGYDKVLVVGNDCPQLTYGKLKKAALALSQNKLVIGPDANGGAYLIGVDKSVFDVKAFSSLCWQTKNLSASFNQIYPPLFLEVLYDVNNLQNIVAVEKLLYIFSSIKKIFNYLINLHQVVFLILNYYSKYAIENRLYLLRAPPFSY